MKIRIIPCLILLTFITGCGLSHKQIIKTQSFGAATEQIGKFGEREFINIRNSVIQMNKQLIAIDNTKTSKNFNFDKPTYAEPTAERIAACKALKLYGELLVKLVTDKISTANLQQAANSLIENTSTALQQELSNEQSGATNKILVGLGSYFIERKRANAVKEIVPAYQTTVDDLANLLLNDFSLDDNSLGYLKAYDNVARKLKNASMKLINKGNEYSVHERDYAVKSFAMAEAAINRAEKLSVIAKESIDGLKRANNELVKIINDKKYNTDDIKRYANKIQKLVNIYQVLSY